jgi:hypothetical protein
MLRTTAPWRLALVRALLAGVMVGAFTALVISGGQRSLEAIVVAVHVALSVGVASLAEWWAARRDRPWAGAGLAGASALVVVFAGVLQAPWAAETLGGGGPEQSLARLQGVLEDALTRPERAFIPALVVGMGWAVPLAALTCERVRPREWIVLPLSGVVTVGAAFFGMFVLAPAYLWAAAIDRRLWGVREREEDVTEEVVGQ